MADPSRLISHHSAPVTPFLVQPDRETTSPHSQHSRLAEKLRKTISSSYECIMDDPSPFFRAKKHQFCNVGTWILLTRWAQEGSDVSAQLFTSRVSVNVLGIDVEKEEETLPIKGMWVENWRGWRRRTTRVMQEKTSANLHSQVANSADSSGPTYPSYDNHFLLRFSSQLWWLRRWIHPKGGRRRRGQEAQSSLFLFSPDV